jgi:hypothetical protein
VLNQSTFHELTVANAPVHITRSADDNIFHFSQLAAAAWGQYKSRQA